MGYCLYFLYILLIFSILLMFTALNPINAILFLIGVFLITSMIFILVGVDFLGILILLVYVGAIAVLFLFIIMMLNVRRIEQDTTMYLLIGLFITFFIICQFQYVGYMMNIMKHHSIIAIQFNFFSYLVDVYFDGNQNIFNVLKLGILIFSDFSLILIFSGILLLVAIVGAIYLTNEKRGYIMKQQYDQLRRCSTILYFNIY